MAKKKFIDEVEERFEKKRKAANKKRDDLMEKVHSLAKDIFSNNEGDIITISLLTKKKRVVSGRRKDNRIDGIFVTRREVMGTTKRDAVQKGDEQNE